MLERRIADGRKEFRPVGGIKESKGASARQKEPHVRDVGDDGNP
jgi:hypothetical protein